MAHDLHVGWRQARDPHPLFDGAWYRETYGIGDEVDP
jgi:hypothetical protein